jgi:hypothetical protein
MHRSWGTLRALGASLALAISALCVRGSATAAEVASSAGAVETAFTAHKWCCNKVECKKPKTGGAEGEGEGEEEESSPCEMPTGNVCWRYFPDPPCTAGPEEGYRSDLTVGIYLYVCQWAHDHHDPPMEWADSLHKACDGS